MNFSTFATSLLESSHAPAPLFYSTATAPPRPSLSHPHRGTTLVEDDILGDSYRDDHHDHDDGDSRDDARDDADSLVNDRPPRTTALGLSHIVPAFVTRLGTGGAAPTGNPPTRSGAQRGWKAYESLAATRQFPHPRTLTESDLSEDDEGPLPGTFVSKLSPPPPPELHPMNEPLMGRRTLFVYPGATMATSGVNSPSRELYRDSMWIAVYGASLALTLYISVKAYLAIPPSPPTSSRPPPESQYPSLISTTPLFLLLSLSSLFTSTLALSLLLVLRRTLRPLLTLSIFIGPFLFSLIGVIAFLASFGQRGVDGDAGWKTGVRLFALGCVVTSWLLGRASINRRRELNRAILVGELACQTIIHHPPLILLSLVLSFVSTVLSFPFLALITTLLSLSPSHPKLASYGSSFALFTYVWTLAMLRGIGKATTSGVVGSWYFEGQEQEADPATEGTDGAKEGPNTVQVTQAAFTRAKGPSLGSILFSSLLTTLLQTLSTLLRSLSRVLRRSSLPRYLSPLTYLVPACDFLAGWTSWYNGYTTVYVGLTGKTATESAKDVAGILFANRGSNIRDTTLLRLLLTLTLSPLTLLPSLVSFLVLSSSYLSPRSGGYAPMFAVLSVVVPAWTGRVVLGLVTDAVDTLFIATHLDAENEEPNCQKAVEAFGEPEHDTLATSIA